MEILGVQLFELRKVKGLTCLISTIKTIKSCAVSLLRNNSLSTEGCYFKRGADIAGGHRHLRNRRMTY